MNRWLNKGLSLLSLRRSLGFGNVFAAVKFDMKLERSAKLNPGRVLVLSPHPDDDAFALGGTLKKMTTAGTQVTVAYFCDGSGGVVEGSGVEGQVLRRDPKLVEIRKEEARKAAAVLGVQDMVFWGYPDGKLAAGTSAVRALEDLIEKCQPEIIFLPSFLDNHGDHRVVNEIFFNAAHKFPNLKKIPVWAYELWTPIYVNRLVDISLYIKTKQEAMLAHESQLAARRYDKAILGLNQYRAEINKMSGFAEGFFAASYQLYHELYEKS